MIMLTIDRQSATPAYRQILDSMVRFVDEGTLSPGDRLPPTRVLAGTIGVHRSTVLRAYEELWALGYIESRPGSYSTVRRHRPRRALAAALPGPSTIDWEATMTPATLLAAEEVERRGREARRTTPGVIEFSRLAADHALMPVDDLRRCFRQALAGDGRDLLDYGEPAGYRPLREMVARRLRVHGVETTPDEVLITNGAQSAIDLVLRVMARPRDRIATESPTYVSALPLFQLHGLDLLPIRMGEDGMDLDQLADALTRERVALVYTIPNFQNPTGITTSQAHRERLLALCEEHRVPILEDGFEEELKYFGKAVLPIKSMDTRGVVAYVGTFSKVAFPGLRVGWLAAPSSLVQKACAVQRATSVAGNTLTQAAVHRFCEAGFYEAHLRRVHKAYRRRMASMLAGLSEHLGSAGVEWTEPQGGYTLWLRVTDPHLATPGSERMLHERFLAAGVKVSPGSLFFVEPPAAPQFRLSVAGLTESEIREGCRRLGRALADVAS